MKHRSRVDGRSGSISQEGCGTGQRGGSIRPGDRGFVRDFQELLKDDVEPDPQFFVECWTLGVTAAINNLQIRLRMMADCEDETVESEDPESMEECFPEENLLLMEFFRSTRPSPDSFSFSFQRSRESAANTTAQAREDYAHFAGDCAANEWAGHPMTLQRACEVLGVTRTSTRGQIKAAYRQKVREWHPDRLSDCNQAGREFANEQMTEINEAYRLLRIPVI